MAPFPRGHRPVRTLTLVTALTGLLAAGCNNTLVTQQGYAPEQPIAFSHATHAGHYGLDCQYCHTGAEKSRHSGVPPSTLCLNCHTQVKTDSPEIQKVVASIKAGQPIAWTRVHRLPDHAYFNHASHVTAGLECQKCHGKVEEMVRVEQVERMTMGWCLDCHRKTLEEQPKEGAPSPALASADPQAAAQAALSAPRRILRPPTDCSACHR